MTEVMTMKKQAILIPYSYDHIEGIMTFGEPFKKEISIRYNRSNWVDIDMQAIQKIEKDRVITNQFYIYL